MGVWGAIVFATSLEIFRRLDHGLVQSARSASWLRCAQRPAVVHRTFQCEPCRASKAVGKSSELMRWKKRGTVRY